MYGTVVEEKQYRGMIMQIVKTDECGGRYYLVLNGHPCFHSLDLERVQDYMNSIARY